LKGLLQRADFILPITRFDLYGQVSCRNPLCDIGNRFQRRRNQAIKDNGNHNCQYDRDQTRQREGQDA